MIWDIAGGVMLGIAPFFFLGCGIVTSLGADRYAEDGRDVHWRAGIWFACGAGCVAAVAIHTLHVL